MLTSKICKVKHAAEVLVNNHLDALFVLVCLFLFSTCFGQPCAHHQENYCINATPGLCHSVDDGLIWFMSLCIDDRLVCIPDGRLHRVT